MTIIYNKKYINNNKRIKIERTSNSLINILCKALVRTSMSGTFVSFTFGLASKLICGLPLKETLNKNEKTVKLQITIMCSMINLL